MTEDIISQIANLGFPIFVALFMLLRLENTLQKFNDTMNQLLNEFKKENK
ncbi:YvrJ family protein [Enterococcus sp. DIV1314a]